MIAANGVQCPRWEDDSREHSLAAATGAVIKAAERACASARSRVPQCSDINGWHDEAFRDVVPLRYYAGNCRQEDPQRICLGINVRVGANAGADFRKVGSAMQLLTKELRTRLTILEVRWPTMTPSDRARALALAVGCAVAQFVRIHPYVNGNGRVSRILWAALLHRFGLPPQAQVVRRPGDPYAEVMKSAMAGDPAPAVVMVLRGLAQTPPPPGLP